MTERYIQFYSQILNKNLDLLIHGHWGKPLLMFPTSMGTAFQNRDSGLLQAISDKIDGGTLKVFNVGSIDFDSYYGKYLNAGEKIYNYELYTRFLKDELIPKIQEECSVHRVGLAGASFGAYHAVNFAFKNPDLCEFVIGMSGSYEIKSFMDGFYNDHVYFNNPVDFVPNINSWICNHMKVILGTSDWDICRDQTLRFSKILGNAGINHFYDEKKWANHDWPLWNRAFPEYINLVLNT
jgi:esterase/lipase superfamily enzyme